MHPSRIIYCAEKDTVCLSKRRFGTWYWEKEDKKIAEANAKIGESLLTRILIGCFFSCSFAS